MEDYPAKTKVWKTRGTENEGGGKNMISQKRRIGRERRGC